MAACGFPYCLALVPTARRLAHLPYVGAMQAVRPALDGCTVDGIAWGPAGRSPAGQCEVSVWSALYCMYVMMFLHLVWSVCAGKRGGEA
jgi:hypothetical protein